MCQPHLALHNVTSSKVQSSHLQLNQYIRDSLTPLMVCMRMAVCMLIPAILLNVLFEKVDVAVLRKGQGKSPVYPSLKH